MKDLTKILKVGDKVWSNIYGDITIVRIDNKFPYPIEYEKKKEKKIKDSYLLTKYGEYFKGTEICTIFPSKENQSWDDYLPDKAWVKCWDNNYKFGYGFMFYDAKNECIFSVLDGSRNGVKFDNYEIQADTPEVIKMRKNLED